MNTATEPGEKARINLTEGAFHCLEARKPIDIFGARKITILKLCELHIVSFYKVFEQSDAFDGKTGYSRWSMMSMTLGINRKLNSLSKYLPLKNENRITNSISLQT